LPDDIIPSPQARQQQVSTIMSLLGNLVAAEEQSYEEELEKEKEKEEETRRRKVDRHKESERR
jgi:hypothetical protein